MKKGASRGARHGRYEEQCDHYQAKMCLRKAKNKQLESILERFQKQDSNRESQMAIGWTEEKCRYLNQLALEDKSCTATRRERQRYENKLKLTLNAQGPVSPMDRRESPLGGREKPSRTCDSKMINKKILRPCRLIPDLTEAIPRTSSSRMTVELADIVKFTFFFFISGTVALF